jgi:SAM-dependent methyltransferase
VIKSYRAIHQWNRWLTLPLGSTVMKAENEVLLQWLERCYGKHAALIGVPAQYSLLKTSPILNQQLLTPLAQHNKQIRSIESDWDNLPISSGSVDLVLLPHTLEYINHPRQVLAEACRITKPEGSLVIFGFNPYSLWGLDKSINVAEGHASAIREGRLLLPGAIKQWLSLADFELITQKTFLFRPPLMQQRLFQHLKFFEWLGSKLHLPFGGIYMLIAKAKVIPLTPIRLHWKQQSADIKLGLPGSSVRNSS